jgi:hypothetical protein
MVALGAAPIRSVDAIVPLFFAEKNVGNGEFALGALDHVDVFAVVEVKVVNVEIHVQNVVVYRTRRIELVDVEIVHVVDDDFQRVILFEFH